MITETISLNLNHLTHPYDPMSLRGSSIIIIPTMPYGAKPSKKEVRKPISDNFAPKRLAINFDPPTISTPHPTQSWSIWSSTLASCTTTK